MNIKAGDTAVVLRNKVGANRPPSLGWGELRTGEHITVSRVQHDAERIWYSVGKNKDNFIPIADVEIIPAPIEASVVEASVVAPSKKSPILPWLVLIEAASAALILTIEYKRTYMNDFFSQPLVQDVNQATYTSLAALVVSTVLWTFLRYVGRTLGEMGDRARHIRIEREDRQRVIDEEKRKRWKEAEEKEKQEEIAATEAKKKAKEEKKARKLARLAHQLQASSLVSLNQVPLPALPGNARVGNWVRFLRLSSCGAKIYDPLAKSIRPVREGDFVHVKDIDSNGLLGYYIGDGTNTVNWTKRDEVEVIG